MCSDLDCISVIVVVSDVAPKSGIRWFGGFEEGSVGVEGKSERMRLERGVDLCAAYEEQRLCSAKVYLYISILCLSSSCTE
jgi:hypothetical protein